MAVAKRKEYLVGKQEHELEMFLYNLGYRVLSKNINEDKNPFIFKLVLLKNDVVVKEGSKIYSTSKIREAINAKIQLMQAIKKQIEK